MGNCQNDAAHFNKRVTIQNPTLTEDGQGGFTESWSDAGGAYCSIEPMKAYERFQAMQMATPVSHKITMRYNSNVDTQSRLVFRGRNFHIKEVINRNEDGRFLDIRALEL